MADIRLTSVKKSYGKAQVIHGVDLAIRSGEFVVILGPSGCGKSTLLRMIAGLEAISDGTIAIAGTVVNDLEPRERGCAMVFQNYALYPHFTVAENIGYALKVAGVAKAERMKKVADVAKSVGLGEYLDRKPSELSGGQRQRVAMGRAMIREPKVFLFDEPLSNLDAKLRVQMRMEIRKLHKRLGTTSVFVTHDQAEAMTLADRIVVMNDGRIEQVGTPDEIYQEPATLFVAGFIGAPPMNLLKGHLSTANSADVAGTTIAVDPMTGVSIGSALVLGIKPEDVEFDASGPYTFKAEFIEKLGALQLVHGQFAGQDFVVQCDTAQRATPGDSLAFRVSTDRVVAFDAASGLALRTENFQSSSGQPRLVRLRDVAVG